MLVCSSVYFTAKTRSSSCSAAPSRTNTSWRLPQSVFADGTWRLFVCVCMCVCIRMRLAITTAETATSPVDPRLQDADGSFLCSAAWREYSKQSRTLRYLPFVQRLLHPWDSSQLPVVLTGNHGGQLPDRPIRRAFTKAPANWISATFPSPDKTLKMCCCVSLNPRAGGQTPVSLMGTGHRGTRARPRRQRGERERRPTMQLCPSVLGCWDWVAEMLNGLNPRSDI